MGFQGGNQAAVLKIKLIKQKYDLHKLLLMKQMNAYHIPFNNINSYKCQLAVEQQELKGSQHNIDRKY